MQLRAGKGQCEPEGHGGKIKEVGRCLRPVACVLRLASGCSGVGEKWTGRGLLGWQNSWRCHADAGGATIGQTGWLSASLAARTAPQTSGRVEGGEEKEGGSQRPQRAGGSKGAIIFLSDEGTRRSSGACHLTCDRSNPPPSRLSGPRCGNITTAGSAQLSSPSGSHSRAI